MKNFFYLEKTNEWCHCYTLTASRSNGPNIQLSANLSNVFVGVVDSAREDVQSTGEPSGVVLGPAKDVTQHNGGVAQPLLTRCVT